MIAVGSDDNSVTYSGKVQIYEYNENTRWVHTSWSSPVKRNYMDNVVWEVPPVSHQSCSEPSD